MGKKEIEKTYNRNLAGFRLYRFMFKAIYILKLINRYKFKVKGKIHIEDLISPKLNQEQIEDNIKNNIDTEKFFDMFSSVCMKLRNQLASNDEPSLHCYKEKEYDGWKYIQISTLMGLLHTQFEEELVKNSILISGFISERKITERQGFSKSFTYTIVIDNEILFNISSHEFKKDPDFIGKLAKKYKKDIVIHNCNRLKRYRIDIWKVIRDERQRILQKKIEHLKKRYSIQ